jgi:hypothetical protein
VEEAEERIRRDKLWTSPLTVASLGSVSLRVARSAATTHVGALAPLTIRAAEAARRRLAAEKREAGS